MKTSRMLAVGAAVSAIVATIAMVVIYTQLTIFVIPPIGAVPGGKTLVIRRLENSTFIDSPDAMCERIQGGVSLLCRGLVLGAVLKKASVLFPLPYMPWLYGISTGGKSYDR